MANQTYLPSRDKDLLSFAKNMSAQIAVDPTLWGLTLAQQAAFDVLANTFDSAMTTLEDPQKQAPPFVQAKNDARKMLIENENGIRKLVGIIQTFPGTTNEMRKDLMITVRDTNNTPVGPPTSKPVVAIKSVEDRTVNFEMRDSATGRIARPVGVDGARIMTWVGDTPPDDFAEWKFEKQVTRTRESVTFPPTVAMLSKVWIAATWYNPKGQTGPFSSARWTNLAGGVAAEAA